MSVALPSFVILSRWVWWRRTCATCRRHRRCR